MAENRVLEIVIQARDEASKTLGSLSKTLKANEKDLKSVAVASGVALGGVVAFASAAVSSANEAQKVQAQLNAVIKSTGGIAGVTADEAINLSRSLQSVTTFGDEAILSAQNMLLTFTKIGKDVFPDATKTVLDMSVALGQDLKSSSIQLGKALNDPIEGVTALRRVGVNFNDEQQRLIRTMVESGRTMEAQKYILAELATEFGGSAEAQAKTFGGQLQQIRELVGDLNESIGMALIPSLQKAADAVKPVITAMIGWIERNPELTQAIFISVGAVAAMTAAVTTLSVALVAVQVAMGPVGWAILGVSAAIALTLIPAITLLIKHWDLLSEGAATAFYNIGETINSWIEAAIASFNGFTARIRLVWNDITGAFRSAIDSIRSMFEGLMDFIDDVADSIERALSKALQLVGIKDKKGKATGGSVSYGQSYVVGEKGPEVFTPATSGYITPNYRLGTGASSPQSITINLNGTFMDDRAAEKIGDMLVQNAKRIFRF